MKVLVTGAGGFLGSHVVRELLKRGHSVRAILRPASPTAPWGEEVEIFRADLRVHGDLAAAFEGIDAVAHVAAATSGGEDAQFSSTVVATERFLSAMTKSQVKRIILIGSFVAYERSLVKKVMDESSPLAQDIYEMGGYTIAKVWQERITTSFARKNGWDLTVVRPGFIWGAGHANIAGMGRKFGRFYIMFGSWSRLPITHVANCANCIVTALEHPAASGEIFNIVDSDDVRVSRYVREYAKRSGEKGLRIAVPYWVGLALAALATFVSKKAFKNRGKLPSLLVRRRYESQFRPLRFDNAKIRSVLNWAPPLSFEQCLDLTYNDGAHR